MSLLRLSCLQKLLMQTTTAQANFTFAGKTQGGAPYRLLPAVSAGTVVSHNICT